MTDPQVNGVKKPMIIMLIILGILFGGIVAYKVFSNIMMKRYFATMENPVVTVSTMKVAYAHWEPKLKAVGSLRATLGVNVTAQLGGMIQTIYFTPGALVTEGTVLVQQNADPNIAQLHALQANAKLAEITYERDKAQYKIKAISKQQLDSDKQNLESLTAQVAQQAAIVDQLTIKAPFSGRLGISNVNPGQYLNPGDKVVTLQRLDPIYADFNAPQQVISRLKVGQEVTLHSDAFSHHSFKGKITTIDPVINQNTRNVAVEATIENPNDQLTPGMFVTVEVVTGEPKSYLTIPQAAMSFNPYGDIIYIVTEQGKDKDGNPKLIANQVFVTAGDMRGDQIAILKGLKEGDVIVTSGQLKLKNGSQVKINNSIQPANNPDPKVSNEHNG